MSSSVRTGSSPNFCPPIEEGITLVFTDERDDSIELEFLGLLIDDQMQYGFFMPVDEDNPALSSGEVLILQVEDVDDEGIPTEFELVEDEGVLVELYSKFKEATKDLYLFE